MVELARAVTSSALPSAIATTVKPSSAATSITATAVGFRAAVSTQSGRSSVWKSTASTKWRTRVAMIECQDFLLVG